MSQLPAEVEGVAAAVLVYAIVCEICNILMIWLVWTNNERLSYVACISYFSLLSTTCSIVQQIHDNIWWRDVVTAQFHHTAANVGNPELVISNGSTGINLVLFYIQYYCYVVEATFVLFWAFSLTQSVYGWSERPHLRRIFTHVNIAGKLVSVFLPLLEICLLQLKAVQKSFIAFIILADAQFVLSCAGGCVFLSMILIKYIDSRRQVKSWSVGYGSNSQQNSSMTSGIRNGNIPRQRQSKGVYDRWLMTRFTIAFVVLGIFEITNILFQITGQQNNNRDALAAEPDFSVARAQRGALLSMPGVTASLLAFVVFGTTRPFRQQIYRTFVPKRFQRREEESHQTLPYASNGDSRASIAQRRHQSKTFDDREIHITLNDLGKLGNSGRGSKASDDELPILGSTGRSDRHGRI